MSPLIADAYINHCSEERIRSSPDEILGKSERPHFAKLQGFCVLNSRVLALLVSASFPGETWPGVHVVFPKVTRHSYPCCTKRRGVMLFVPLSKSNEIFEILQQE